MSLRNPFSIRLITARALRGMAVAALFAAGLLGCNGGQAPTATVTVTGEVVLSNPTRLGVNLGAQTYYGDHQYVENPLLQGGFSKGRQALIARTKSGGPNSFVDADFDAADKDRRLTRELTGGTYYVGTGARAGEHGTIVVHDLATGTFTTEKTGPAFQDEQYVWLRGPDDPRGEPDPEDVNIEKGLGIGDFRLIADDGVKVSLADTQAGERDQALNILLPPELEERGGGVKHYLRATSDTGYSVRIRARSALPGARIAVTLTSLGIPSGEGHILDFSAPLGATLTPEWRDLLFEGHTTNNRALETKFSALEIVAAGKNTTNAAASIEIDEIRLEDLHLQSETAFTKQVVAALQEARPGTLRFYNVFDIALATDDFTTRDMTDAGWTYLSLASGYRIGQETASLDQCLTLAKQVGARPWITVGNGNTPEDWYQLISYLAGPSGLDADSARRAAHGFDAPWTDTFDTIYLEIGNEWWNSIFYPFSVSHPEQYGELCKHIIDRVKQHPNYDPARIKIINAGWAINAHHWNDVTDAHSSGHDYVSVAPYLLNDLDVFKTPADKYSTLFAAVDAYAAGPGKQTRDGLATNGKGTRMAVYELNTHLTGGQAPDNVASEICTSAAAGVAVLDQAMSLMANFGASPVNYFVLLQRDFNGRQGLWGTLLRDNNGDLRARPVWHGLRLANNHLIDGDLVRTNVEGGGSWRQAENGSVPAMSSVPNLHAYAFVARDAATTKRRANVLLVNRSITSPVRASVTLPFTPGATAKAISLIGNSPAANNEDEEHVRLETASVNWPGPGGTYLLPPCSATVLQFSES